MNVNKWNFLALAICINIFVVALPWISIPFLFPGSEGIASDLGLEVFQTSVIWSMTTIPFLFVALPMGLLGDRIGIRHIIALGCMATGIFGLLRGLAPNFTVLVIMVLLYGASFSILVVNLSKVIKIFFPAHQLGMASGFLGVGMMIGESIAGVLSADILSPVLGGWRSVMILYGAIAIMLAFAWFAYFRGVFITKAGAELQTQREADLSIAPFRESLSIVIRNKSVWIASLALFGQLGCWAGAIGYLPTFMQDIRGFDPAYANRLVSSYLWAGVLGSIAIPWLSDKFGRRLVYIPLAIVGGICTYLFSILSGSSLWAVLIIGGFSVCGCIPVVMAMLIGLRGLEKKHTGTALGLFSALGHLGPFTAPIIGGALTSVNTQLAFLSWAIFPVLGIISFCLIKDGI